MADERRARLTKQIVASTGIVMAGILASRFLGFFRDWTVAHQIGSNASTDAYYAAFTLSDFLNYLVAGGALSITFIPVFTKYVAEGREDEGWQVFSTVVTFMSLLLIALVIIGEVYARPLVATVIAPGIAGNERNLLVFLTRLMMPAQICFYVGGILAAVQYARGRFLLPSLAPIIYNSAIILGGVLLSARIGVTGFSIGVLAGALCGNLLLQIYGAYRVGARFWPRLNLRHPGFILFVKLAVPIMFALSLPYTDDWITRWFASYMQHGAITWLTFGKRLMQVPLGIGGQAINVAAFPVLAQLYSEQKYDELNRLLNHTVKAMMLLLVPVAALTVAQSGPLVRLVYTHTRLNPTDLRAVAVTLLFFAVGLAAWGAQGILSRGFYAARDTLTPAIVGTAFTFLSLPLYWYLAHRFHYLGLALASSVGISLYALTLFLLLVRRTRNRQTADLFTFFVKLCGASAVMAAVCYPIMLRLGQWYSWHSTLGAFVDLVIVTSIGLVLLYFLCRLFRLPELEQYLAELWRMVKGRLTRIAATTSTTPQ